MTETNPGSAKPVRIIRWVEVVFDALYLLAAACIGIGLLLHHAGTAGLLSGVMALVLAGGDAFHLIPRMIVSVSGNKERMNKPLGIGKLVTSITMTLFYVLLWHVGLLIFAPTSAWKWTVLVYILAGLRIVLCLFKQNGWTCKDPSVRWAVLRNIPFLLLGMMTAVLFLRFQTGRRASSPYVAGCCVKLCFLHSGGDGRTQESEAWYAYDSKNLHVRLDACDVLRLVIPPPQYETLFGYDGYHDRKTVVIKI